VTRPKKTPPSIPHPSPEVVHYPLERLHADQGRDWVIDAIPAVLAWMPGADRTIPSPPFSFTIDHVSSDRRPRRIRLELSWDLEELRAQDAGVEERARRLRTGRTVQREHVTELAAYGLSFVAISILMPGRRVVAMRKGLPPDILFDVTPGKLRGVEVAGRATGGRPKLLEIRDGEGEGRAASMGKAALLRARSDVVEAHISLWCASPKVAIMEQVKP